MPRSAKFLLVFLLLVAGLGGVRHFSASLPKGLREMLAKAAPWLVPAKDGDTEATRSKTTVATAVTVGRVDAAKNAEELDPKALPHGLLSIDGSAGQGYERSVRKSGTWFPVYDQNGAIASVPLLISSGPLPKIPLQSSLNFQAEAIGGSPPYDWSLAGAEVLSLSIHKTTGLVTSDVFTAPVRQTLTLSVKDHAGTVVSAQLQLSVAPEAPLAIASLALTPAVPNVPYAFSLTAQGGTPPYSWTVTGLPAGIAAAADGRLSGQTASSGEFLVQCQVKDAWDEIATKELSLTTADSLVIITEASLPTAAPGKSWEFALEAEGGQPPYRWSLADSPPGITLDAATGVLRGLVTAESLWKLAVTVTDSEEATFSKTFRLAISGLLITQAGQGRVGLAWQPQQIFQFLAPSGLQAKQVILSRNDSEIYSGPGRSFVDSGLLEHESYDYTLSVLLTDDSILDLATKQVTLSPFTLKRGTPGKIGDPYPDQVVKFQPLTPGGYGAANLPGNVLGPPDGKGTFTPAYRPTEVVSLHASNTGGGFIELAFVDNIVALGPGEDLTVFENVLFIGGDPNQRFMEPATVSVALFPGEWHTLPTDVLPPANGQPINFRDPFYYARGLAGRNATTGEDPTDPKRSGGDSFDLDPLLEPLGIQWIRYVRIQSTGDAVLRDDAGQDAIRHAADAAFAPLSGKGASGFDLDAVSAVRP